MQDLLYHKTDSSSNHQIPTLHFTQPSTRHTKADQHPTVHYPYHHHHPASPISSPSPHPYVPCPTLFSPGPHDIYDIIIKVNSLGTDTQCIIPNKMSPLVYYCVIHCMSIENKTTEGSKLLHILFLCTVHIMYFIILH